MSNAADNDRIVLDWASTNYTTGGAISWVVNDNPYMYMPSGATLRVGAGASATSYLDIDLNGITGTGQTSTFPQYVGSREGNGTVNASSWGYTVKNSGNSDALALKWASTTYTTGGAVPWVLDDNPYLYVPTGKSLRIGFGTANFTEISNTTLYAGTSTATFAVTSTGALQIPGNGSDSLSTVGLWLSLAGTEAFNWQLSASGHADLWTYTGSAWQDSFRVSRTGNAILPVVGTTVQIKQGTNACAGVVNLSGGTATVNTTKVTANSMIFLTPQVLGTVTIASGYAVTARTAGTSFTITASAATDTSTMAWWIVEPAP